MGLMKTRTQLVVGILALSSFISLPVLAQNNSAKDSLKDTPSSTGQSAPSSTDRPAEGGTTPSYPVDAVPTTNMPSSPSQSIEDRRTPNSSVNAAPASKNLVEEADSSNQFKTLAKAIKAAGLESTLAGKGPYTIFAPTDKAFAALPPGVVEQLLLPENKEILMQLLSYHVIPGAVTSTQIKSGQVETLVGEAVTIQLGRDGAVSVNNAKVTQADIQASNGVIHAIDQVILPPDTQAQPQENQSSPQGSQTQPEAAPSQTQPEAAPKK